LQASIPAAGLFANAFDVTYTSTGSGTEDAFTVPSGTISFAEFYVFWNDPFTSTHGWGRVFVDPTDAGSGRQVNINPSSSAMPAIDPVVQIDATGTKIQITDQNNFGIGGSVIRLVGTYE